MKTGTSSIQAALAGHPEELARAGWRYLGWPIRRPEVIEKRLNDVPADAGAIVVDEGWWHFAPSRRVDLAAIAQKFHDFDVTIVVYLRRPDRYVEAWFSQGLKHGTGKARLDEFLVSPFVNGRRRKPAPGSGPYAGLNLRILSTLKHLAETFPDARIVVRPYERQSLVDGDVVHDFLDVLGIDAAWYRNRERAADANVTQDSSDLLLIGLLRQRYGVPETLLKQLLDLPRRQEDTGRILTFEEASGINEAMRPDFRKVQATWGGGVSEDFFADWTLDPETYRVSPLRAVYDEAVAAASE